MNTFKCQSGGLPATALSLRPIAPYAAGTSSTLWTGINRECGGTAFVGTIGVDAMSYQETWTTDLTFEEKSRATGSFETLPPVSSSHAALSVNCPAPRTAD